jgi:uncharacterized membrane protein (DUF485 family)
MQTDTASRIVDSPAFVELAAKRGRFSWTLAIIMLVVYYGFIVLVAFFKDFLSIKIGGVITLAFPIGLGVIVVAIALTGIYVLKANGEFDRLTRKIVAGER